MTTGYQITIDTDGRIEFVAKPELTAAFGPETLTQRRASHVEPTNRLLRALFRLLRAHSQDDSLLAAWTRRWPCQWQVSIVDGPRFGPFAQRTAAIDAEVEWLNQYRL